ncbi:MAG TPA: hypothetical protein VF892_17515 [Pseudonocardiaceae bacterium]|nr:hypothetical protein [Pseudonocardiaceae bacterium]
MDFSLHEKRRLAQLEQDLSGDRRLVALMRILGSGRGRSWRRLRYAACRVRRPRFPAPHHRWTRLAVLTALLFTVATPVVLVVALMTGMSLVAVITVSVAPMPPLLLILAGQRARRLGALRAH